ncbi:MAG: hypothetical protein IPN42_15770 [Methylococcaceae bacterium]|nr:hypothetical protein [Methylococcaceae bacterium]
MIEIEISAAEETQNQYQLEEDFQGLLHRNQGYDSDSRVWVGGGRANFFAERLLKSSSLLVQI